jgi:hypothetical protein
MGITINTPLYIIIIIIHLEDYFYENAKILCAYAVHTGVYRCFYCLQR